MNIIFTAVVVGSGVLMCFADPNAFLPAVLKGAEQAALAGLTLFGIYSVWMGLSRVAQDAGISGALAKKMRPLCFKLFATKSALGAQYAAVNLTCNVLGLGGAATPAGVAAMKIFDGEGNMFGRNMLFILNATSVQIVPATVIALRAAYGGQTPADIFLPAILTTLCCTGTAVAAYFLVDRLCR